MYACVYNKFELIITYLFTLFSLVLHLNHNGVRAIKINLLKCLRNLNHMLS